MNTTHWLHERFEQNLSHASGGLPLSECAKQWRIDHVMKSATPLNCQVCNTRMNQFVALRNEVNGNRLIIGTDCYDKLQHFLVTGKVESALPDRESHLRSLKSYTHTVLSKTVLGWLYTELASGTMPDDIRIAVESIQLLGFAPSIADADRVVEFYKNTRKFDIRVLVPGATNAHHARLLPKLITIAAIDRVKQIIQRGWALRQLLMRQASLHRETRRELFMWDERLSDFVEVATVKRMDAITDELRSLMEDLIVTIRLPASKLISSKDAIFTRLTDWWNANRFKVWPRVRVAISSIPQCGNQVCVQMDRNEWRVLNLRCVSAKPEKPGLYWAHVICGVVEQMFITSEAEGELPKIAFNIPSSHQQGEYVGRFNSKIALPRNRVTEKGVRQCVVLEEKQNFVRVYAL